MNEEKGTRCNELMVLAKYLKYLQKYLQECLLRSGRSKYGCAAMGRRIKPYVQGTGTWTVEVSAMSVHGPAHMTVESA